MTPITALGSRYGIQGALGRSVKRASSASTWWDLSGTITSCVAAYQAKGVASYAASKVNLANAGTYDLSEGSAPTWNSGTGWTFNGTSQFLFATALISPDVFPNNQTWSIAARFVMGTGGSGYAGPCGIRAGNGYGFGWATNSTRSQIYYHNSNGTKGLYSGTSGTFVNAGTTAYKDGTSIGTIGTAPVSVDGYVFSVGCSHSDTGSVQSYFFPGDIIAISIYNTALTSTQVGLLTTAMAAL